VFGVAASLQPCLANRGQPQEGGGPRFESLPHSERALAEARRARERSSSRYRRYNAAHTVCRLDRPTLDGPRSRSGTCRTCTPGWPTSTRRTRMGGPMRP